MTPLNDELLEYVSERYDPELVVEVLGLSTKDILIAFYDTFIEQRNKFDDEQYENSQATEEV
jgi:hypothetical protein